MTVADLQEVGVEKTKKRSEDMGQITHRIRRLTEADLDPKKPRHAERIFKVITQLIANEDVLDWSVLSDPDTWVLGIFEGALVDGKFTDEFLVGMTTVNFKHTWTGWKVILDDVVVFSHNRRLGVGSLLVDFAEELGRKHKPLPCRVAMLESDREEAFQFYFSRGYLHKESRVFKKLL